MFEIKMKHKLKKKWNGKHKTKKKTQNPAAAEKQQKTLPRQDMLLSRFVLQPGSKGPSDRSAARGLVDGLFVPGRGKPGLKGGALVPIG